MRSAGKLNVYAAPSTMTLTPATATACPARKTRLSPKKLLLTQWTAVMPTDKEKHFLVRRVIEPTLPETRIGEVELEAVHSGRSSIVEWRELTDGSRWRQGWV